MKSSNRLVFFTAFALFFTIFNQACAQLKSKKTAKHAKVKIKEKNSRTELEQKIDSRLLQAIREHRGEKNVNRDLEPVQVNADNRGNLQVDIKADITDNLLNKIKSLGGNILSSFPQYRTLRAQISLTMVETIAGYTEVKFIEPAVQATTQPVRPIQPVK